MKKSNRSPEDTKKRLVEAGLELFGAHGIDGVSTRQLAEKAAVNLASIPYHFGGKEGVYLAVAQHIVESTGSAIQQAAQRAIANSETLSREDAATRAGQFLSTAVRVILAVPGAAARGGFVVREQLQPTKAFDVLYDGFIGDVHRAISSLVARATGSSADALETIVRAHALVGSVLVFGLARAALHRRLQDAGFANHDLTRLPDIVATAVAEHTVKALREGSQS